MKRFFLIISISFQSFFLVAGPTEDLLTAINNTDLAALKTAIASGADVNVVNTSGFVPLMLASWQPEMVKELITAKADLNKSNSSGAFTPLTFACYFSIFETAQLIGDAGADMNLKTASGTTPLHAAVMSSRLDLVKYILSKGGDPKVNNGFNQNLIMLYAGFGKSPDDKADYFKMLEEMTVKLGNKVPQRLKDNQNPALFTPVTEMLDYLLSLGLNINEETDVMVPANTPNAQVINDANKKAKAKQSAMSIAFNMGHANADILAGLLSKGASMNKKVFATYFSTKRFPSIRIAEADVLLIAVKAGNIPLVKTLVENSKININKTYDGTFISDPGAKMKGLTPMMIAAANNDKAMCEYLVSIGARGMPMAKIDLPPGNILIGSYALKAGSYAEDFATDEGLKKYLKSLVK